MAASFNLFTLEANVPVHKYGALNGLCSTLYSKSKLPYAVFCVFTCSAVLEYGIPMLWHYCGEGTFL